MSDGISINFGTSFTGVEKEKSSQASENDKLENRFVSVNWFNPNMVNPAG